MESNIDEHKDGDILYKQLDEQDLNCYSSLKKLNETINSNNDDLSFICSNKMNDESNLKKNEALYIENFIRIEDAEKSSKIKHDAELESLKTELEKLKEADAAKSAKISELLKENTSLKKSICSLYQTVKSEVEHKDQLLAEANRKIDNILFRKYAPKFRTDRAAENQTSDNDKDAFNKDYHKRKRSTETPKSSVNDKGNEPSTVKSKNSNLVVHDRRSKRYASERNPNVSKDINCQLQKHCNQRPEHQTSEGIKFSDNSRDSTETNNLFFSLLPSPLKKSFQDYENSQIISLNRLKQSFISEYFNSSVPTSSLECVSKNPRLKEFFDKKCQDPNTVLLTPSSEKSDSTLKHQVNNVSVQKTGKVTRSNQQDLVTLFKYRKERIPFLDKRKFGLLKDGKDLIPKNLL